MKGVEVDERTAREQLERMVRDSERTEQTLDDEDAEAGSGELADADQHPGDYASDLTNLGEQEQVTAVTSGRAAEARAALRRMDAGEWGRCVDCGRQIPDERLAVRPQAARCVDCERRAETTIT